MSNELSIKADESGKITCLNLDYPLLTLLDKSNNEILRFENDGSIYVHGKLIENDKQVVDGFIEFLNAQCL